MRPAGRRIASRRGAKTGSHPPGRLGRSVQIPSPAREDVPPAFLVKRHFTPRRQGKTPSSPRSHDLLGELGVFPWRLGVKHYANIFPTTFPPTSVSRKSRPWN